MIISKVNNKQILCPIIVPKKSKKQPCPIFRQWRLVRKHKVFDEVLNPKTSFKKNPETLVWFRINQFRLYWAYLPDVKKCVNPTGMGDESVCRKLDLLIEKCSIPWDWRPLMYSESQSLSTKSEESLQWIKSTDFRVSLFCFRSWHNPSTYEAKCGKLECINQVKRSSNYYEFYVCDVDLKYETRK